MSGGPQDLEAEGHAGLGRVEAFSDGVIAIIVTIMVLELHPPLAQRLDALWTLWPVFLAYVLSYAYVAIYWVNHHRLFGCARRLTNGLLWSNMLLLFALSLVPFSTSYLGEHLFSRPATWVYLGTLLFPAVAYTWLQAVISRTGRRDAVALAYYRSSTRKGWFTVALYLVGVVATVASPWFGVATAALVAVAWFLPTSRIDRWFEGGHAEPARGRLAP